MRIDKVIRNSIRRANSLTDQVKRAASNQAPKVFRAHLIGVTSSKKAKKGKRHLKKKGSKKSPKILNIRAILKLEKKLDRKYQK